MGINNLILRDINNERELYRLLKENSDNEEVLFYILSNDNYMRFLDKIGIGNFIQSYIKNEKFIKSLLLNKIILDKIDIVSLVDILFDIKDINIKMELICNDVIQNRINIFTLKELIVELPREQKSILSNDKSIWERFCIFDYERIKTLINEVFIKDNLEVPEILVKYQNYVKKSFNSKSKIIRELNYNIIKLIIMDNDFEKKYEEIEKLFIKDNLPDISNDFYYHIIKQIIRDDKFKAKYEELEEKILLKDNLPQLAKVFLVFKFLNPNLECFQNSLYLQYFLAPQLKDDFIDSYIKKSKKGIIKQIESDEELKRKIFNEVKFMFIFNDIVRININSNNESLRCFLYNLEKGNSLFYKIIDNDIDYKLLDDNELKILNTFLLCLENLQEFTKNSSVDYGNCKNLFDKIKVLVDKFQPTNKYSLLDRIVRNFFYYAGYTTYQQVINDMDKVSEKGTLKGISNESSIGVNKFLLEGNDFIRFIGTIDVLCSSLDDGNFSKEYLSGLNGVMKLDSTPGDIDFFRIPYFYSGKAPIEFSSMQFTNSWEGNVYVVIRNNENINITRGRGISDIGYYDPKMLEAFYIGLDCVEHWGIRTGISILDIDYILIDTEKREIENGEVVSFDISKINDIKNKLIEKGIYIPIFDMYGTKLFSYDEFLSLKKENGINYSFSAKSK